MKKLFALLPLAALLWLLAVPALAIEFSADVVRKGHGMESTSKFYIKDQKIRMDSAQGPMGPGYSIIRQDRKVMWMVSPAQKSYFEMPMRDDSAMAQQPRAEEKMPGEISRKELGREVIDGHPCIKYEINYQVGGQTHSIHQWMAQDIKLPVKTAAVDGSWSVEYRNINKGPQPDSLFEVPGDYQKMSMPGFGPGMGQGAGPGMGRRPGMGGQGMGGQGMGRPGMGGQGMPPAQDDDEQ